VLFALKGGLRAAFFRRQVVIPAKSVTRDRLKYLFYFNGLTISGNPGLTI
jgi:hypothetical protein